ncbi:hypothetical protein BGZ70_009555 [Mortierella alpina]|uniref:Uncharacterized protein n=1 Tax=Mortierella alpina TaxID=64518 RepID=A0A9P6J1M4_MORAP|nr:hypothetical protein BGZ70_009555 [Mortierella alpina]
MHSSTSLSVASIPFTSQQLVAQFQTGSAAQQGLVRNAPHVRAIDSYFCYAFQSLPETLIFQNLVRLCSLASELHNKGIVDHTTTRRLLTFVKVNKSLRELNLTNFPLASQSVSSILGEVIAGHPELMSLTLSCFREADLASVQDVLRGAARSAKLEKLSLVSRSTVFWSDEMQKVLDENTGTPSERPYALVRPEDHGNSRTCRLKDLVIDFDLERSLYVTLLPLLRLCPDIKRLHVPTINMERSMRHLCQVLESHCPGLQHLEAGYTSGKDEHQELLINASPHLLSLCLRSALPLQHRSISALLHHRHCHSLERLDLRQCSSVSSRHLQLLLTSCPNLTSFEAMSISSQPNTFDPRLDIKDLPVLSRTPAWACRGLRVLHIGFSGFSNLAEDRPRCAQAYVDYIYNQLAELTELRVLHLGGEISNSSTSSSTIISAAESVFQESSPAWAFDFSLKSGLEKLATLQELRTLKVQRLRHHRIGRAEAEWVLTHWPRLRTFHGPPECVSLAPSKTLLALSPVVEGAGRSGAAAAAGYGESMGTRDDDGACTGMGGYVATLLRRRPWLTVSVSV